MKLHIPFTIEVDLNLTQDQVSPVAQQVGFPFSVSDLRQEAEDFLKKETTTKKKRGRRTKWTEEQTRYLVDNWAGNSLQEPADHLGFKKAKVSAHAVELRKRGVVLSKKTLGGRPAKV